MPVIPNTPETALSLVLAKQQFRYCRNGIVLKEIRQGKCLCVSRSNPYGEHWWIDVGFDESITFDPAPDTSRYGVMKRWNYQRNVYECQINDYLAGRQNQEVLDVELSV